MKRSIEKAAVAMVTVLVGACSTEVGDERGRQGASDNDAASNGGANGHSAGSGGAGAAGGTATGGSSIDGGGGGGAGGGPGAECVPPLVPDAGSTAMYECSSDVTRLTRWGDRGCGEAAGAPMCPSAHWGCGPFDVAREALRACTAYFRFGLYEGRELGFLVIVELSQWVVSAAYYDEATGEMVGYFEMGDAGVDIRCAGRVPKEKFGRAGFVGHTGLAPLCARDGGVLVDAGSDGPAVDAGSD